MAGYHDLIRGETMYSRRSVKRHAVTQPSDQSYKLIPLTHNRNAIVDTADFEWLSQFNWYLNPSSHGDPERNYAATKIDSKRVRMHKMITGWPETDHHNGDGLDNRRHNLRKCTNQQNQYNKKKVSTWKGRKTTSRFKGVGVTPYGHWRATIRVNGKPVNLGNHKTELAAAQAYRKAATKLFGEFARF